ncbi:HEPN domain-containing protein [Kitasatospora sp. NPDC002551]|uniref:HEPN domain-containing protein n=1 Tax=Kitasatospora sp. NPDC002551 TaxID=3154539 RepID=UPI003326C36D
MKHPPKDRTDDENMWIVRFFVVRVCGYLEQVVNETLKAYIEGKSGGPVQLFAKSWIEKSRNPSPDNMLEMIGRLGGGFELGLQGLLDSDDQRIRRELLLLLDRRHKIAHGLNEGLTGSKAIALYECVVEIVDWFLDNLNPDSSSRNYRT